MCEVSLIGSTFGTWSVFLTFDINKKHNKQGGACQSKRGNNLPEASWKVGAWQSWHFSHCLYSSSSSSIALDCLSNNHILPGLQCMTSTYFYRWWTRWQVSPYGFRCSSNFEDCIAVNTYNEHWKKWLSAERECWSELHLRASSNMKTWLIF